jgi:aminoglycoside phosphotransferase (APT) family kinase protein
MQPDPSVYLRAIRDEMLSPELFSAGLASGASPVIMRRAAEGLAHLALRGEALAGIVRAARAHQLQLLAEIDACCKRLGVPVPGAIHAATARAAHLEGNLPGEADIKLYDELAAALADGIRAMAGPVGKSAEGSTEVDRLSVAVCRLELEQREAYEQLLAQARISSTGDAPAVAPPPDEGKLTAFLRRQLVDSPDIAVSHVRRLAGFNSKEIFLLEVTGCPHWPAQSVMRREPAFNVTGSSLTSEWELLGHLRAAGVAAPRVLIAGANSDVSDGEFIVMERLSGSPRPAATLGHDGRRVMLQLARSAAHFHQVPIPAHLERFADLGQSAAQRTLARVERYYRRWQEERVEDSVVMEATYRWLISNVHRVPERAVLVHGDFSLRNVLLEGDRITGLLDWELSHAGDPAEDLSYMRPDVESCASWDEFLAEYHIYASQRVDEAALTYFEVWGFFWRAVISALAYAGYIKKSHRNFMYASVAFIEHRYNIISLCRCIAKAAL